MKHSNHRLKTPEPIKSSRPLQYYGEFELFSFVFVKPQPIVKTNYYFQNETHPADQTGAIIFNISAKFWLKRKESLFKAH